jgi:vitamin B12 transporter
MSHLPLSNYPFTYLALKNIISYFTFTHMKPIILALVLLLPVSLLAQVTTIQGMVKDGKGNFIKGANISIKNSYDGATTDSLGYYNFTTSDTGSLVILCTNTGFKDATTITIANNTIQIVNIILKEKVTELKAIVVTAGSFEASDTKRGTVLKALDMVTTAGTNGDNFSALKTLPGTQQTNDREGLFVRGGTGAETQTFIDGTLVRNAFLTGVPDLGARGRFNPFLFKGTTFSAGGYSALYGQALSSAVLLETEDIPDRSQGFANLSTVGLGAGILKINKKRTQSVSISLNHTNLAPYFLLIKQNISYKQAPLYNQVDVSARQQIGKRGLLKFYGYYNIGNVDIQRADIDSYSPITKTTSKLNGIKLNNKNLYLNTSFKLPLANRWRINAGACYSTNIDKFTLSSLNKDDTPNTDSSTYFWYKNSNIINYNSLATAKVVVQKSFGVNAVRFGTEYIRFVDSNLFNGNASSPIIDNYTASFAEGDINITNDIAIKAGVRGEYNSIINKYNIAPRAAIAYKINGNSSVNIAYGIFYQKPETRFLYQNSSLDYMQASHYIAQYVYQKPKIYFRAEVYNKNYQSLIKTPFTQSLFSPVLATNNGKGYARGVELFYRDQKTLPGIDYWISYSYIDTKRDFLNYLQMVQPDFVANHVGNIVFKKFWQKKMFGINGTYTFSSGRPYINYNTTNPINPTSADARLFMTDRTPSYHNLSLSCNYLKGIGKTFNVFVISINNPFYIPQTFGYNYSLFAKEADGSLHRQAITPPARTFIFLGIFTSWGVDRSNDAINNNL